MSSILKSALVAQAAGHALTATPSGLPDPKCRAGIDNNRHKSTKFGSTGDQEAANACMIFKSHTKIPEATYAEFECCVLSGTTTSAPSTTAASKTTTTSTTTTASKTTPVAPTQCRAGEKNGGKSAQYGSTRDQVSANACMIFKNHLEIPETEYARFDCCVLSGTTTSAPSTTAASKTITTSTTTTASKTTPDAPTTSGIVGYYAWNWLSGTDAPKHANAGVAFTGLTNVDKAIAGCDGKWSNPCDASKLSGTKYISLGGGNAEGSFTSANITAIGDSAQKILDAGYHAVMFDVEEVVGSSEDLIAAFSKAFAQLKQAGLKTGVTTSHSAPYQADSAMVSVDLVKAWVKDENLDIISPQLYSGGEITKPLETAETSFCKDSGCTWDLYKNMHKDMIFAPSIIKPDQYSEAQAFFKKYNITCGGYFQWAQIKADAALLV